MLRALIAAASVVSVSGCAYPIAVMAVPPVLTRVAADAQSDPEEYGAVGSLLAPIADWFSGSSQDPEACYAELTAPENLASLERTPRPKGMSAREYARQQCGLS